VTNPHSQTVIEYSATTVYTLLQLASSGRFVSPAHDRPYTI